MKTRHLNTENFVALIIGASKFQDNKINDIPNINKNIELITNILANENTLGIPKKNIFVSLNETKIEIERKIIDISRMAKNHNYTLLVYYAGHGVISSDNYQLFLTAHDTTINYLERDGLSILNLRDSIQSSRAGRKIVILDACHSGQIHGAMNNMNSLIQVEINKFEGTYIMTSASEDEPSLFPTEDTEQPTYFTEMLVNAVKNGIDNGQPFITLTELFNEVESTLREKEYPLPQQSSFQNIASTPLFVNAKYAYTNTEDHEWNMALARQTISLFEEFIEKYPNSEKIIFAEQKIKSLREEKQWENAQILDVYEGYLDFIQRYPKSDNVNEANKRMLSIEEENEWISAANQNSILAILEYLEKYPEGRFINEATLEMTHIEEKLDWQTAIQKDTLSAYMKYKQKYPNGKFLEQANAVIQKIKSSEEDKRLWNKARELNTLSAYKDYLKMQPEGTHASQANEIIEYFESDKTADNSENLYIKHYVAKKDNIQKIARKYRVSAIDIRKVNNADLSNISNKDPIKGNVPLDWIKIPIFRSSIKVEQINKQLFVSSKELSKRFNRQIVVFFIIMSVAFASITFSNLHFNEVPETEIMQHLERAELLIENLKYRDAIIEYKQALDLANHNSETRKEINMQLEHVYHLNALVQSANFELDSTNSKH